MDPSSSNGQNSPLVSVIIPVYNGAERVVGCLTALEKQTYPRDRYEIIVVDNGSTDHLLEVVMAQFPQVLLVTEEQPGSYAARNTGIAHARGDVLAFTDADCIPEQSWIERGVRNLLSVPSCGLVAGRINVYFRNPDRATPVELFESITAFPQKELLDKRRFGATANVFTTREVINKVGSFDPRLKSHGDLEWGQRIYASEYQQIYADDVCVSHPARYSIKQLYNRTTRLVGGQYLLHFSRHQQGVSRNIAFAIRFVGSLFPPLFFVLKVVKEPNIKGVSQKINVCLVMFFVRYLSAWELIQLKLGKNPAR